MNAPIRRIRFHHNHQSTRQGMLKSKDVDETRIIRTLRKNRIEDLVECMFYGSHFDVDFVPVCYSIKQENEDTCNEVILEMENCGIDLLQWKNQTNKQARIQMMPVLLYQMIRMLHWLKLNKIVHSNIRPEHVFINERTGRIKLLFWGSAHLVHSNLVMKRSTAHTMEYADIRHFNLNRVFIDNPYASDTYSVAMTILVLSMENMVPFDIQYISSVYNSVFNFENKTRHISTFSEFDCLFGDNLIMRNIVKQMCSFDHSERPTTEWLMNHPYFHSFSSLFETVSMCTNENEIELDDITIPDEVYRHLQSMHGSQSKQAKQPLLPLSQRLIRRYIKKCPGLSDSEYKDACLFAIFISGIMCNSLLEVFLHNNISTNAMSWIFAHQIDYTGFYHAREWDQFEFQYEQTFGNVNLMSWFTLNIVTGNKLTMIIQDSHFQTADHSVQ